MATIQINDIDKARAVVSLIRDHAKEIAEVIQAQGKNAESVWIAEELAREVITALEDLAESLKKQG